MQLIREVVEQFIRTLKAEVHPGVRLVGSGDLFEVTDTPSVILQGPTLSEDVQRRTLATQVQADPEALTYEGCSSPRLYHLDFDIVATTASESELLEMTEQVARFYQLHPLLTIAGRGSLGLTEMVPLGGLQRVNLSNLRQASGKCRIEDCPIYDGRVISGKLTTGLKLELGV